jgi:hypothetical protein
MGPDLRWIVFSDKLPRGKGLAEIVTIFVMATVVAGLGDGLIEALTWFDVPPEVALEIAWPTVGFVAACFFGAKRFSFIKACLIALGLSLIARGMNDNSSVDLFWQLQVGFGFWLALRVFSIGSD